MQKQLPERALLEKIIALACVCHPEPPRDGHTATPIDLDAIVAKTGQASLDVLPSDLLPVVVGDQSEVRRCAKGLRQVEQRHQWRCLCMVVVMVCRPDA